MELQDRIQALQAALDKVNDALAALDNAPDGLAATAQVDAQHALLDSERQQLGFEIGNLQMAIGEVREIEPDVAARIQTLSAELGRIVVREATVTAALDFANAVLEKASDIRRQITG